MKRQASTTPTSVPVRVIPPGVTGEDLAALDTRPLSKHGKRIGRPSRWVKQQQAEPARVTTPRARVVKARKPTRRARRLALPTATPSPDPLRTPARQVAARVNGAKGGRPPANPELKQLAGGVRLSVTVALSAEELQGMDSERLGVLFGGLAQLLSVREGIQ